MPLHLWFRSQPPRACGETRWRDRLGRWPRRPKLTNTLTKLQLADWRCLKLLRLLLRPSLVGLPQDGL